MEIKILEPLRNFLREIGIEDPDKYIVSRILPFVVVGLILFLLYFLVNVLALQILFLSLGVFSLILSIFVPYMRYKRIVNDIENNLPYFITFLACVFSAKIEAYNAFDAAAKAKYFGYLSNLFGRLKNLVFHWKIDFNTACKHISSRVPLRSLKRFLDRLSIFFSTTRDLEVFFEKEKEIIISLYEERYRSFLESIDAIRDIYATLAIVIVFLFILGMILPYLFPVDIYTVFSIPAVLMVTITGVTLYIINSITPPDKLYEKGEYIEMEEVKRLKKLTTHALFSFILILGILLIINVIPFQIAFAIATLPLLIPAIYAKKIEHYILKVESGFGEILRILGDILKFKGKSFADALEVLLPYNFGELNKFLERLYKRLKLKIDKRFSWVVGLEELGSSLIKKFGLIFYDSIDVGAEPDKVGLITSKIYEEFLVRRDKKFDRARALAVAFTGVLLVSAIALHIGIGVMNIMNYVTKMAVLPAVEEVPEIKEYIPFTFEVVPTKFFEIAFFIMLEVQALTLALIIPMVRGSFWQTSFLYFVAWTFMIAIVSLTVGNFFTGILQELTTAGVS